MSFTFFGDKQFITIVKKGHRRIRSTEIKEAKTEEKTSIHQSHPDNID